MTFLLFSFQWRAHYRQEKIYMVNENQVRAVQVNKSLYICKNSNKCFFFKFFKLWKNFSNSLKEAYYKMGIYGGL